MVILHGQINKKIPNIYGKHIMPIVHIKKKVFWLKSCLAEGSIRIFDEDSLAPLHRTRLEQVAKSGSD